MQVSSQQGHRAPERPVGGRPDLRLLEASCLPPRPGRRRRPDRPSRSVGTAGSWSARIWMPRAADWPSPGPATGRRPLDRPVPEDPTRCSSRSPSSTATTSRTICSSSSAPATVWLACHCTGLRTASSSKRSKLPGAGTIGETRRAHRRWPGHLVRLHRPHDRPDDLHLRPAHRRGRPSTRRRPGRSKSHGALASGHYIFGRRDRGAHVRHRADDASRTCRGPPSSTDTAVSAYRLAPGYSAAILAWVEAGACGP